MMIIPISKLRVGQRFSFIPSAWFGQCKLVIKSKHTEACNQVIFDIKFEANVVNPLGVIYGIPSTTKVRLLSRKSRRQTKGARGGIIV